MPGSLQRSFAIRGNDIKVRIVKKLYGFSTETFSYSGAGMELIDSWV